MKFFKIYRENGLFEVQCEHGVGHPSMKLTPPLAYYGTHGCDGCCRTAAWLEAEKILVADPSRDSCNVPQ